MGRKQTDRFEDFDQGDVVMDDEGVVFERGYGDVNPSWWGFGSEWPTPDGDMLRPLRKMVAVGDPVSPTGDPMLYRITYDNGKVKHGHRRVLGPVLGAMRANYGYRRQVKIEQAPEPSWVDATEEFLGE